MKFPDFGVLLKSAFLINLSCKCYRTSEQSPIRINFTERKAQNDIGLRWPWKFESQNTLGRKPSLIQCHEIRGFGFGTLAMEISRVYRFQAIDHTTANWIRRMQLFVFCLGARNLQLFKTHFMGDLKIIYIHIWFNWSILLGSLRIFVWICLMCLSLTISF